MVDANKTGTRDEVDLRRHHRAAASNDSIALPVFAGSLSVFGEMKAYFGLLLYASILTGAGRESRLASALGEIKAFTHRDRLFVGNLTD